MLRSQINDEIAQAKEMLEQFQVKLPRWAYWGADEFAENEELADYLAAHQMGWDVTDFSTGKFLECGLTLFCLRNGIQKKSAEKPYAEKLLFIKEGQVTPYHCHRVKMEDIINRGGGVLTFKFIGSDRDGTPNDEPVEIRVDGEPVTLKPREALHLHPGQSATMERNVYHCFYAEPGTGTVLGGEVSQVNDDENDNCFLEPLGRFSEIVEDAPVLHPLWNELRAQ